MAGTAPDPNADHPPLGEDPTDVVWSMTPDGTITFVSREVEDVRGVDAQTAKEQDLPDIQTPESVAKTIAYLEEMRAITGPDQEARTFRDILDYKRADGSLYRCLVVAVPKRGEDGRVTEIVGVSRGLPD